MYLSQIGKSISGAGFCDGSGQTASHAPETLPATWSCICLEFQNIFVLKLGIYLRQIQKCISGAGFWDGSGQTASHVPETARSLPAT